MGAVQKSRATGRVWVPTAAGSVETPATSGDVALSVDPTTLLLRLKDSAGNSWPLAARNKYDATAAPGVSNDDSEGYSPGSEWVDVTNDKAYKCLDASTGAAVWTETTGAGGGGTHYTKGTTFPGGPTTNDEYYRTDVRGGTLFFYDGTRWVSDQIFKESAQLYGGQTSDAYAWGPALPQDYSTWMVRWESTMYISGSGVWESKLQTIDFDNTVTTHATQSSTGQTASKWYGYGANIGSEVNGTGPNSGSNRQTWRFYWSEISGAATCYGGMSVYYRIIAT